MSTRRNAARARAQGRAPAKNRAAGIPRLAPPSSPAARPTSPIVAKAPTNSAPGKGERLMAIDGVIGEKKATAAAVRECLAVHGKGDLTVELNSEGGAITEGVAIYHALRKHEGKVTVRVTGLAASMGSVILQAGDHRVIASGAYVMIHNPSLATAGESDDLRRGADLLDKMRADLLDIYEARTGLARDKIAKMMDEETWLNATEAKALGFVDEIEEASAHIELRAVAQLDAWCSEKRVKRTPDAVRAAAKKAPGARPAAKGNTMDEEEAKALRAELAALKAENERLKAKNEDGDEETEEESEGAGDDEPHSEDDDKEKEARDKAAAQAAEIEALAARGYLLPKDKAAAIKMSPRAFASYSDRLIKMGPIVPTNQIKPPAGKMPSAPGVKPPADDTPAAATEAEKAYMKCSGKTLEQVRALAGQSHSVTFDHATRKAV